MKKSSQRARGKLLDAWSPPAGAGEPIAALATSFSFDAAFFEEELIASFLGMETGIDDGDVYRYERESRLGAVPIVALVDRRHVDKRSTLAWDLLGVHVPLQCCQHAKVSVLAWERHVRVVIASANLTPAGYRTNVEVFATLDFHDDGDIPRSVLDQTLAFLETVSSRVPGPDDGDSGPRARAQSVIDAVRMRAATFALPDAWSRGVVQVLPVFLLPGEGATVPEQMRTTWGTATKPSAMCVCSPFWGEPSPEGRDRAIETLVAELAPRGERYIDVYTPGAPEHDGQWVAHAPSSILASRTESCHVEVWPVGLEVQGESRRLHAKLIRWFRTADDRLSRDLVLVGSSNATTAGLGVNGFPRNIEANVVYVSDLETRTTRWMSDCFPEHAGEATDKLVVPEVGDAEDEGGDPPVPAFFGWADATRSADQIDLHLGFTLREDEPADWTVEVEGTASSYRRQQHRDAGRPDSWTARWPATQGTPFQLVIHWRVKDVMHRGMLPVNASGAESRCDDSVLRALDLDGLIDVLGDERGIYRALARRLQAQSHPAAGGGHELDPHRRVDTSGYLVPRMRRISRALDGLQARLSAPLHSATALGWRFAGPLGPVAVASVLMQATPDVAERAFLLVEVLATLARARKRIAVDSALQGQALAQLDQAVVAVQAMLPKLAESAIARYVKDALEHHQAPQLKTAAEVTP